MSLFFFLNHSNFVNYKICIFLDSFQVLYQTKSVAHACFAQASFSSALFEILLMLNPSRHIDYTYSLENVLCI